MKTLREQTLEKLEEIKLKRDIDVIKGKSTFFYDRVLIPKMQRHLESLNNEETEIYLNDETE